MRFHSGAFEENSLYTFIWATKGKVPLLFRDSLWTLPGNLAAEIQKKIPWLIVTRPATGYPVFDEVAGVTLWAVQIRTQNNILSSPNIDDIYEEGKRFFLVRNSPFYKLYDVVDSFYVTRGPYSGRWVSMPGAFQVNLSEVVDDDPVGLGIPGPIDDTLKSFRDVFVPTANVLRWGLAGIAAYGLWRVYGAISKEV